MKSTRELTKGYSCLELRRLGVRPPLLELSHTPAHTLMLGRKPLLKGGLPRGPIGAVGGTGDWADEAATYRLLKSPALRAHAPQ